MEKFEPTPPQPPKETWEERKEREYKEAVKAVEELYSLSFSENYDETKLKELEETIGVLGPFQDRLIEKERGQFYEALPLVNKLAVIFDNFRERDKNFYIRDVARDIKDLSSMARMVLDHGLGAVDETLLNELDEERAKSFFDALEIILRADTALSLETAMDFLEKNKEILLLIGQNKNLPEIQERIEGLETFLKTREFEEVLVRAIDNSIEARRRGLQSVEEYTRCMKLLKGILERFGLNAEEILKTWEGSHVEHGVETQVRRNMERIFGIEDKREGIAQFLYKEFGIRNFERYPEELLIAQFDERDNVDKPYGVMLQATHDWNGAFASWSDLQNWSKLYEQIKEKYAFRVAEAKSKQEVARRLITLNKKYGEHQKISFAFIGGHGMKDSIMFGGRHLRNILHIEDLEGEGVKRTGQFFEPHPVIVLVSCSTGAEGGIGQELSKTLGAKVIAPTVPTNLESVEAILSDEGIDFKVEYDKRRGDDIRKVYTAGEKNEV